MNVVVVIVCLQPPERLLELVLCFISKEKCYSKLSELVRVSMKCSVKMGCTFYEKAAAELNQWGQDPDSARLATVMSAGELVEQEKPSQPPDGKGRGVAGVELCGKAACEGQGETDDGGVVDMEVETVAEAAGTDE